MRVLAGAALAVALGLMGVHPATAAPLLGPCDAEITDAPSGSFATPCTYYGVTGLTGTLRLWVYSGRAEATVICTVGGASLAGGPGAYDIQFTRVGRCTLTLTSLVTTSSALAASL